MSWNYRRFPPSCMVDCNPASSSSSSIFYLINLKRKRRTKNWRIQELKSNPYGHLTLREAKLTYFPNTTCGKIALLFFVSIKAPFCPSVFLNTLGLTLTSSSDYLVNAVLWVSKTERRKDNQYLTVPIQIGKDRSHWWKHSHSKQYKLLIRHVWIIWGSDIADAKSMCNFLIISQMSIKTFNKMMWW